jgi:hypothetical protein
MMLNWKKWSLFFAVALSLASTWAACDKDKKKKTTPKAGKKSEKTGPKFKLTALHGRKVSLIKCKKPTGGKIVVFDINRDPKKDIDIWKVFRKNGSLACREMDMNYDGKRDLVIEYYRNGLDRKTMWQDQDFDGKFDIVLHLRPDGSLEKTEMDTNSDGKIDLWKSYRINRDKNNVVFKVVRDRDFDGYRDYWERYDESGTIDEVSWTDSGDKSENPRYWLSNPTPHESGVPKEETKEPSARDKKKVDEKKASSGDS